MDPALVLSFDFGDLVNLLEEDFQGEPPDVALYKMVNFTLFNPDELRQEAEEAKRQFFSSMFESRFFDYEGRTVAVAPGALTADDVGYEERIKSDVQRNAGFRRNFAVSAQISNALRIVTSEHTIDAQFLTEHIVDRAFIPEGRLEHYVEGLVYGFNWQFTPAVLFLVPQFEAGLRNIAEQLGLAPRTLKASGVEDVWGLDRLLSEEAIISQLGKPLTFEVRSLLIEEFGPKFRHNLSHGLIPPSVLGSTDALYAWWLFLRLCVIPTSGFCRNTQTKRGNVPFKIGANEVFPPGEAFAVRLR